MVETPYGYYDRGLDEDKEEPMVFEEQFILRVPDEVLKGDPAAGVKGLREAVLSRKPIEGVSFKFKGEDDSCSLFVETANADGHCTPLDDRKAVFNHGNKSYSAKLVDLPCIIEGQKVLENKRLFKVADISQVSICLGGIQSLPSLIVTYTTARCLWLDTKSARKIRSLRRA
jgi:transcription initiation factor TFIID subunit 7